MLLSVPKTLLSVPKTLLSVPKTLLSVPKTLLSVPKTLLSVTCDLNEGKRTTEFPGHGPCRLYGTTWRGIIQKSTLVLQTNDQQLETRKIEKKNYKIFKQIYLIRYPVRSGPVRSGQPDRESRSGPVRSGFENPDPVGSYFGPRDISIF